MDDRLEKALEFANYRITLSNQKRSIRQRMHVLQTVHHNKGVFVANPITISFVKSLVDSDRKSAIVLDTKETPITIEDTQELLDLLLGAYTESTNEYKLQMDKVTKARNIKSLMDW
tara:strand:+ start:3501 stop:3848 length:348 start_codon:yes stop_codon:yes gene_type:complete